MTIEGRTINRKRKPCFVDDEITDNRITGLWGSGDREKNRRFSVFFKYTDGVRTFPVFQSFQTMENAIAYRDALKAI